MNKLTKAAIAGAAGIALLLGGAGSLAYWNSSVDVNGGTVTSGVMTINAAPSAATTTLHYGANDATGVPFVASSMKIIPGHILKVKQPVVVTAEGQNLTMTLGIDKTNPAAPTSLYDTLVVTVDAYAGTSKLTSTSNMTASQAQGIDSVLVSITFPDSVTDEVLQGATAILAALKVTLTQNPTL